MSDYINPYVEIARSLSNVRSEVLAQAIDKLRSKRDDVRSELESLVYLLLNARKVSCIDAVQKASYMVKQIDKVGEELSALIQEVGIPSENVNRCNFVASILSIIFELSG